MAPVAFGAVAIHSPGALAFGECRGESLCAEVIVEADRRQRGHRTVVGLQHQQVGPRRCQLQIGIRIGGADVQARMQVDRGTARVDRLETRDAPRRDRRALAVRTVPDLQGQRHGRLRRNPVLRRLQPEIVRGGRHGREREQNATQPGMHIHSR